VRTLVLGLGNPIMGDDAVGLRVAQEVRRRLGEASHVRVEECCSAGISLLDRLVECDALVVVDALRCALQPGTVLSPTLEELPRQPVTADFHAMGLPGMLELGRHLGLSMPQRVAIIGVAVAGDFTASDTLSPEVERAVASAADRVLEELSCASLA